MASRNAAVYFLYKKAATASAMCRWFSMHNRRRKAKRYFRPTFDFCCSICVVGVEQVMGLGRVGFSLQEIPVQRLYGRILM